VLKKIKYQAIFFVLCALYNCKTKKTMKKIILITLIFGVNHYFGQEVNTVKKEVRRTIGLSSSILSNANEIGQASFSYIQRSLVYRQCWKSYIFSAQLSMMKQENAPMNYFSSGHFAYVRDNFFVQGNSVSKMNGLKLGVALHKGWTNDKFNVYLGMGLSGGKRQGFTQIQSTTYFIQRDSSINENSYVFYDQSDETYTADFLTLDVNLSATLEIKLFKRITGTVSFNPEFSTFFAQNVEKDSYYYRQRDTFIQHNGIQLGLHYRIQ
jgi:hypothetical protein